MQEAFSGIRVLKSFNREAESIDRFAKESNEYKHQSMKLTRVQSLFFPIVTALIGISTVLTIYAGSVEVINGTLTFGNIAEFVIYVNLLTWPVTLLGWTSSQVQRAGTRHGRGEIRMADARSPAPRRRRAPVIRGSCLDMRQMKLPS